MLELTGGAARGLYVASSEHSAAALDPTAAAQRFMDDFGVPARASSSRPRRRRSS